jgi:hypothetical protein
VLDLMQEGGLFGQDAVVVRRLVDAVSLGHAFTKDRQAIRGRWLPSEQDVVTREHAPQPGQALK